MRSFDHTLSHDDYCLIYNYFIPYIIMAASWHKHCTTPLLRACWDVDVPSTYIVTTEDVALPVEWQDAMIESVRE